MSAVMEPLPEGWILKECKDYPGRAYYYNEEAQFSTWERPPKNDNSLFFIQHICVKSKNSINPIDRNGRAVTRSDEEAEKIARMIFENIKINSKSFTKFAEMYSDYYDPKTCGAMGWVKKETFLRNFPKISKLTPGSFSEVIKTRMGYHIFKCLA